MTTPRHTQRNHTQRPPHRFSCPLGPIKSSGLVLSCPTFIQLRRCFDRPIMAWISSSSRCRFSRASCFRIRFADLSCGRSASALAIASAPSSPMLFHLCHRHGAPLTEWSCMAWAHATRSCVRDVELAYRVDALAPNRAGNVHGPGGSNIGVVHDQSLQRHVVRQVCTQYKRSQRPNFLRRQAGRHSCHDSQCRHTA